MPLVTETDQPRQGKHRGRAAWLLLFPLALGLALLLAAGIQPLQFGPYVLTTAATRAPGIGWRCDYDQLESPPVNKNYPPTAIELSGQPYVITGEARALIFGLGDYGGWVVWFRGHRER